MKVLAFFSLEKLSPKVSKPKGGEKKLKMMKPRQRNSFQDRLLEHVEYIVDHSRFPKDQYLVSRTDEKGQILLEDLLSYPEIKKLNPNPRDLRIALTTSTWLRNNVSTKPTQLLRLPFQIDTKTLLLYELPKEITSDDILKFVKAVNGNYDIKIKRHKLGVLVTFPNSLMCMAFWRSLGICMLKGYLLKGMIFTSKPQPRPSTMGRSQSMTFQKKLPRPEKLPQLKIVTMKDQNFPSLN